MENIFQGPRGWALKMFHACVYGNIAKGQLFLYTACTSLAIL